MKSQTRTLVAFSLVICIGCIKRKPENLLVGGQWVTEYNREHGWWNRVTYSFINDSIVDTKHKPYFRYDTSKSYFKRLRSAKYLGTKTKYKIEEDSLKIYDLEEKTWGKGIKLAKLTKDTLILTKPDEARKVFVRKFCDLSGKARFDKIVLHRFPGWAGAFVHIIIEANGNVFVKGHFNRTDQGEDYYFVSTISAERFKEIEENFLRVDYNRLRSYYDIGGTDATTISTTFCKGNKIVKSVVDYGPCGPDELVWAYPELEFLYQSLDLKRIPDEKLPLYTKLGLWWMNSGKEEAHLSSSDNFLLSYYLMKGVRILDQAIQAKYIVTDVRDLTLKDPVKEKSRVSKVESDGRLFKFYERNGESYIIDIGFNFLDENFAVFKEEYKAQRTFESNAY